MRDVTTGLRANAIARPRATPSRIGAGAHDKAHAERAPGFRRRDRELAQWPIKRLDGTGLIQRILFHVTDHACDFPHHTWKKRQRNVLADRILVGPETLRHGFAD